MPEPDPEGATSSNDPVLDALSGAQAISRSRGVRPRRRRARPDELSGPTGPAGRGGYSGPAPDATDPQTLGAVTTGFIADRGWERPLAEARVFSDWAALVGPDVAAHSTPTVLRAGELRVSAESTAWATQLRLLAGRLVGRLTDELGPGVVTKVIVTGPVAPSWKHGRWSVPGARGPRDTYG